MEEVNEEEMKDQVKEKEVKEELKDEVAKEEEIERKVWLPGIEPSSSEVEVEGANHCAMPSQTKL